MKWENVTPDIHAQPLGDLVKGWSALDVLNLMAREGDTPLILISDNVKTKIVTHLSTKRVELGGLLIGSVYSHGSLEEGITSIEVKDAVASQVFDSSSVSLSMTPEVWQSANKLCDENTFVVGWYHSHPNLGAFFSGTDRKTQKDFFNHAYSLGLVIDPIRHEECWFIGPESQSVAQTMVSSISNQKNS